MAINFTSVLYLALNPRVEFVLFDICVWVLSCPTIMQCWGYCNTIYEYNYKSIELIYNHFPHCFCSIFHIPNPNAISKNGGKVCYRESVISIFFVHLSPWSLKARVRSKFQYLFNNFFSPCRKKWYILRFRISNIPSKLKWIVWQASSTILPDSVLFVWA